ncbi:MAG: SMC family ATPase, partial [Planctomycetota bacterium]
REALHEAIVKIQTRIETAKKARDLETALARHQQSLDLLEEVRERDYAVVVGWVLADYLQKRSRDQERPQVFHRARELFTQITRGHYRLEFEEGDPPAFRALDTTTRIGHSLAELSSGTRVQLLLAVRVAFGEKQERGLRPPLVLDEVLATSDDQRAQAIMEATFAISQSGRQVFYFTAQEDELEKWQALRGQLPEVPFRLIHLAEAREGKELSTLRVPRLPESPVPEGVSHEEYGKTLGVPALHMDQEVGAAHLWHFVEDLPILQRLLKLGIERWGQLQTFLEHGGANLLAEEPRARARVQASAQVWENCVQCFRLGRGKPVDRACLIESRAVTQNFLEEVWDVAQSQNGNAEQLLDTLEKGGVKRFRSGAIEELGAYLEREGYLDLAEPLKLEEIRERVLAAASGALERGVLTMETVERLLGSLQAGDKSLA